MLQYVIFLLAGILFGCAGTGGSDKGSEMKGADKSADHAKKDEAGLGHDYRTFMANGDVKFGQIGDSYTADLV